MADLPQQITIKQYLADGLTKIYPYNFLVPLAGDVQVYVTLSGATANPASDLKLLNVDYTVQSTGDINGGTITFTTPPANGAVVTFSRNVAASIDTNFANAATFNGQNLDNAFQRVTLVAQQNQTYALTRNLSYRVNAYLPPANLEANTQLPVLGAQQVWMGSGGGVINATIEQGVDVSLLRSQLLNSNPVGNGASIVGYYDPLNSFATTVQSFLDNLPTYINTQMATQANVFKSGMLMDFAGAIVPNGWLACDGSAISRVIYASLFLAIGTIWGIGDGSTTFNLPDLRRRVTVGEGGAATSPQFPSTLLGAYGGEEVHTQLPTELAPHVHNYDKAAIAPDVGWSNTGTSSVHLTLTPTTSTGSGTPMNVMQLGAVVNKIIKI